MSAAAAERVELAPGYSVARVINGGWQLARDHGGGVAEREEALEGLLRLAERGFTTFDCADIYGGVEELLGELRRRWSAAGRTRPLEIHTKYVPDRSRLATLRPAEVERAIERSRARLGVERLDLVQFHWWDYSVPGYVEAAVGLDALRRDGRIRHLGVTNFDRPRLAELLDAGVRVVSNQVQYSLLDRRPEHGMAGFCEARGIRLVTYGALGGGFLSGRWLGAAAPGPGAEGNRSLTKYRLIIEEFGGWECYQELLAALAEIAGRLRVEPAQVAARWVLDRPGVASIILGAGSGRYAESNLRLFSVALASEDRRRLTALLERSPGPAGDVYDLERDPRGRHAAILRTDLREA